MMDNEVTRHRWMVMAVCLAVFGNLLLAFVAASLGLMAFVAGTSTPEQLAAAVVVAVGAGVNLMVMAVGRRGGRRGLVLRAVWTAMTVGAGVYCAWSAVTGFVRGHRPEPIGWGIGALLAAATLLVAYRRIVDEGSWVRCRRCGYDLLGSRGAACPECGAAKSGAG